MVLMNGFVNVTYTLSGEGRFQASDFRNAIWDGSWSYYIYDGRKPKVIDQVKTPQSITMN